MPHWVLPFSPASRRRHRRWLFPLPADLLQHKNEAKAFYAFLSQVYDYIVNPGHWTEEMREDALAPARLDEAGPGGAGLQVVDVGGGTGFCTRGILKAGCAPGNVTLIDQSPQQLDKARAKPDLQGVTILEVGGEGGSGVVGCGV